ncbi:uncharacterized protein [Zea mays]|uniref:uncharacterized protein n=1 Tax=Zea mays TaxID=4577 RepID=UPI000C6C5C1C|nr:uncharacterized protein LOC111589258 [Zea mays]|eukprot:XP_023157834.1 uncharacterized protein LOC111589258 [Zea mays]
MTRNRGRPVLVNPPSGAAPSAFLCCVIPKTPRCSSDPAGLAGNTIVAVAALGLFLAKRNINTPQRRVGQERDKSNILQFEARDYKFHFAAMKRCVPSILWLTNFHGSSRLIEILNSLKNC